MISPFREGLNFTKLCICKISQKFKNLQYAPLILWVPEPNYSDRKSICKQNSPKSDQGLFVLLSNLFTDN